ncbi:MAG: PqqD family protein [Chloroflexota bacterium]
MTYIRLRPRRAALPCRSPHVTERLVDGELVLYDPQRQRVHVLNATAALIWHLCDGRRDRTAIAASLSARFAARRETVTRDVSQILTALWAESLLQA